MEQKPMFYDGSGTLNMKPSASKSVIIKPEGKNESPSIDVNNKPSYYDGSGTVRYND